MPKILLLSCCAPCSCGVIAQMAEQKEDVTVLFYNPNIRPREEYEKRLLENKRVCEKYDVPFVALPYETRAWEEATADKPFMERGPRCSACFRFRLTRAAEYAKALGFDYFTSVLGVSRYKDLNQVNKQAEKASRLIGVPYDFTNWRKGGLQEKTNALIKEMNLYCQDYCGCTPTKAHSKKKS